MENSHEHHDHHEQQELERALGEKFEKLPNEINILLFT